MTRGAGPAIPRDLDAWRRWQERRHPLRLAARRARALVDRGGPAPTMVDVRRGGPDADLVVAVEATHASVRAAVIEVLPHLDPARVVTVAPAGAALPEAPGTVERVALDRLASHLGAPRAVLAAGHYTPIGEAVHEVARRHHAPFLVSQHGLLTPHAPPLPTEAHLLGWSDADVTFWTAGRPDVRSTVVGSQLLAQVQPVAGTVDPGDRPVYLGQLHAAELSRTRLARAAAAFCRAHDATYRPHPSERDRISRLLHAAWRRRGIRIDTGDAPLAELVAPVVSVFSTGVLEAAARGLPAYVDFPDPPSWLQDFWERYDMRPYGGPPTPAPQRPEVEPAQAVARLLEAS